MEQASKTATELQSVRRARKEITTRGNSLTLSSDRHSPEWQLYLARTIKVIQKSINLSNSPALTEKEISIRAEDWLDALHALVPSDRLMDAFDRAVQDHQSSFPVNAYEVKNAWSAIELEEAAEQKITREREISENAVANCPMKDKHVVEPVFGDEGMVEMQEGFDPGSVHLIPCFACRPKAFAQAQARRIEERAGAGVPDSITAAVDQVLASKKPTVKPPPETAMEYLDRFYEMVRVDYDKAVGQKKDDLLAAGFTIVHAMDYVKANPER